MTVALSVMMGLAIMAVFVFALWKTDYLTLDHRLTSPLIPRQSPETAYGQVRPIEDEVVTYDEVARRLPGWLTDMVEASMPCPRGGGRHIWESALVEIRQFGKLVPIRLDEYLQCGLCGAAIDVSTYHELNR